MASCPPNKQVYDAIRKQWIEATPEEVVRQKLLHYMIHELGYPKHLIAVEKQLSELPQLKDQKKTLPLRRLDILCFDKKSLSPLLLIECKSIPIQEKMLAQLLGYNAFVRAPFICLANDKQIVFGWMDEEKGEYRYHHTLPPFEKLICPQAKSLNKT